MGGVFMKKIFLWLKKHMKCWHEGHDYAYREWGFCNGGFICKRCGKVSTNAVWSKEELK